MSNPNKKAKIIGQGRTLKDDEAAAIQEMIAEAQGSSRKLTIPAEDLHPQATTTMRPEVAAVIDGSRIRQLLHFFNRDYLYGRGRFDEYSEGLLLKWGDGYSRKHIWMTVVGDNLRFETSHERPCDNPFCIGGYHVYGPSQWGNIAVMNAELSDQFQHPVYERSDD